MPSLCLIPEYSCLEISSSCFVIGVRIDVMPLEWLGGVVW